MKVRVNNKEKMLLLSAKPRYEHMAIQYYGTLESAHEIVKLLGSLKSKIDIDCENKHCLFIWSDRTGFQPIESMGWIVCEETGSLKVLSYREFKNLYEVVG